MTTNQLSQSFDQLIKAEKVDAILKYLIACCWFQDNNDGEPPVLTPRTLKDWMPSFRSDVAMRWLVDAPDDLDNTPVPKEWDDAAHYYLEICFRQHTIDVPEETEPASPSDFPIPPLLHKARTIELVLNESAIAPRLRATFAMVAILDTWEDAPPKNAFFQKYGIRNFEEGIEAVHALWTEVNKKHNDKFIHPLAPIIRQWLTEQQAKHINGEYDRQHPAAIIDRASMGSIRDVIVPSTANWREKLGDLKGISTPAPETKQIEIPGLETQTYLPAVLPLQAVHMVEGLETTKRGAVAMPIRLFFESIMALEPKETEMTIRFKLGNLLRYLNPNSKYHRTRHLSYVLQGLHSLYFLRIPYRENPDKPSTEVDWIPVLPRTIPNQQSGDDASIILELKLPPDATSGMMVEKDIIRLTGKQSSPKFNAYLAACWIFDRFGTTGSRIIDPTRPVEARDADGYLVNAHGQKIYDSRGKPIKNPYHSTAVKELDRILNDARRNYPILSFDDLTRACFPKGFDSSKQATYRKRALTTWDSLHTEGIVRIEKHQNGWRIMPSEPHIGLYRAVQKQGMD